MVKRKKSKPETKTKSTIKKTAPRALYGPDWVAPMSPPNNLVSTSRSKFRPFPILAIRGKDLKSIFFHPMHASTRLGHEDVAPTWMDPHLLIKLASSVQEINQLLERIYIKNEDVKPPARLLELLRDVFYNQYLVVVAELFETNVEYMADWIIRHYCDRKIVPGAKKQRNKR